jgi:hypothetical protein
MEMRFDRNGSLSLGDRAHIEGGSATARALLFAAVDSRDCFLLENNENSPLVAFGQIEATMDYTDYTDKAEIRHVVWTVMLDFQDFSELRGPADVIKAFGPAMILLHELGHGVLKLHDPGGKEDPLGECERHINQIRRELGLPERESYYPQVGLGTIGNSQASVPKATLIFVRAESGKDHDKTQWFALLFNVENVGIGAHGHGRSRYNRETMAAWR